MSNEALAVTENSKQPATAKLSLVTLTGMVVGSMVGAGVISLPGRFASATGVAGALIAWTVAGLGMLTLALVFQMLAIRKPDLNAGVYAYAKAGFGQYVGFFSGFGYWASACAGNTFYWVFVMSTLSGLGIVGLGAGDTVLAVVVSTLGLWGFFFMIRRGIENAAVINRIVTIAKVVPILVFIAILLFLSDPSAFAANWAGADYTGSLFNQVRSTMLVTVFVFLGVEGASVYSRHAKKRSDVGKATLLGSATVFAIFASVVIVSYGVMPMADIAALPQPSMAGVLEDAVGPWGMWFVSIGLIISVLGAYLAWTLMAAEVLNVMADDKDMPRFLSKVNQKDVPVGAVAMTSIFVQVLLVVLIFAHDALNLALDLTSALSLIPFFLAALYAFKLLHSPEVAEAGTKGLTRDPIVAALAVLYTAFLLFAAGWEFLLKSFIIYAPATILFAMVRREQGQKIFQGNEIIVFIVSLVGAALGVLAIALGWIQI